MAVTSQQNTCFEIVWYRLRDRTSKRCSTCHDTLQILQRFVECLRTPAAALGIEVEFSHHIVNEDNNEPKRSNVILFDRTELADWLPELTLSPDSCEVC
ncbi:MAG: DUF2703 domain-containing protein, partial [Lentisphaerae bacterium]